MTEEATLVSLGENILGKEKRKIRKRERGEENRGKGAYGGRTGKKDADSSFKKRYRSSPHLVTLQKKRERKRREGLQGFAQRRGTNFPKRRS